MGKGDLEFFLFHKVPGSITIKLIVLIVFCLNAFSLSSGSSRTYRSHNIVTGQTLDLFNHCMFEFGSYIKYHEDPTPLNTIPERTHG